MTTSITFRTDAELKADVEDILEDIGMNMSTAFNCFLAKIRDVGGIPFALARKSKCVLLTNPQVIQMLQVQAHILSVLDHSNGWQTYFFLRCWI